MGWVWKSGVVVVEWVGALEEGEREDGRRRGNAVPFGGSKAKATGRLDFPFLQKISVVFQQRLRVGARSAVSALALLFLLKFSPTLMSERRIALLPSRAVFESAFSPHIRPVVPVVVGSASGVVPSSQ